MIWLTHESLEGTGSYYTLKDLRRDHALGCAVTHSLAYMDMGRKLSKTTGVLVSSFITDSDFVRRKKDYYQEGAAVDNGAHIIEHRQPDGQSSVVGLCIVSRFLWDKSTLNVEAVYVDPDHAGRGLGSILLQESVDDFPDWKRVLVTTTEGSKAVDFYKKRGFQETGQCIPDAQAPLAFNGTRLHQTQMELLQENADQLNKSTPLTRFQPEWARRVLC